MYSLAASSGVCAGSSGVCAGSSGVHTASRLYTKIL